MKERRGGQGKEEKDREEEGKDERKIGRREG